MLSNKGLILEKFHAEAARTHYQTWQNNFSVLIFFSPNNKSNICPFVPTLCDPMGCSLPGSSVRGILQARVLEWVAVSFSRRSSQPRIEPGSPILRADTLPSEPLGNTLEIYR